MIASSTSVRNRYSVLNVFLMSLKFIRFELIKISVASFGIGVNIKLEKGERLAKGSRGLGLGSGKLLSSRQIVLASYWSLRAYWLLCVQVLVNNYLVEQPCM